ncbi:hypothetical protein ACFSVJ_02195 [Prauserella oleivorans]
MTATTDEPCATHPPGELTLARLLQEQMLRDARASGPLDRVVTWCLPWEQAVEASSLAGVLVYAAATPPDPTVLAELCRRDPAAVLIAGTVSADRWTKVRDTCGRVPVVSLGEHIGFREIGRLVAELTLAHEAHVLRYGVTVHRVLAELLYRGAGMPALAHQLSRLSHCTVAILDARLRILAFAQPATGSLDQEELSRTLAEDPPALIDESLGGTARPSVRPRSAATRPPVWSHPSCSAAGTMAGCCSSNRPRRTRMTSPSTEWSWSRP